MGLNATVYCNCVELGLLRTPHPYPGLLYICENGCQAIKSSDLAQQMEHDRWQSLPPCAHEDMHAYSTWLGNMFGVGFLRNLFTPISARPEGPALPVLLNKVIYSGVHGGDYLSMGEVIALQEELRPLKQFDFKQVRMSSNSEAYLHSFFSELQLLIDAALKMNKPISF